MIKRLVWIYVSLVLLAAVLTACAPLIDLAADPVRQAEAAKINAQTDMEIARQKEVFQQQDDLAKAQVQAQIIDAQTRAQTAALWVIVGGMLVGLFIACGTVLVMFVIRTRMEANRPVVLIPGSRYPTFPQQARYTLPISDNQPIEVRNDSNYEKTFR